MCTMTPKDAAATATTSYEACSSSSSSDSHSPLSGFRGHDSVHDGRRASAPSKESVASMELAMEAKILERVSLLTLSSSSMPQDDDDGSTAAEPAEVSFTEDDLLVGVTEPVGAMPSLFRATAAAETMLPCSSPIRPRWSSSNKRTAACMLWTTPDNHNATAVTEGDASTTVDNNRLVCLHTPVDTNAMTAATSQACLGPRRKKRRGCAAFTAIPGSTPLEEDAPRLLPRSPPTLQAGGNGVPPSRFHVYQNRLNRLVSRLHDKTDDDHFVAAVPSSSAMSPIQVTSSSSSSESSSSPDTDALIGGTALLPRLQLPPPPPPLAVSSWIKPRRRRAHGRAAAAAAARRRRSAWHCSTRAAIKAPSIPCLLSPRQDAPQEVPRAQEQQQQHRQQEAEMTSNCLTAMEALALDIEATATLSSPILPRSSTTTLCSDSCLL